MHDLDAAMLRFRQNARGNEINARFLEKVRDNLKNASQRVRDVYKKEVELARLYQEAMKSVDEGYEKQGGHIADIQRIKRETKA